MELERSDREGVGELGSGVRDVRGGGNQMLDEDSKVDEASMAVDMASQAMEEAVRSTVKDRASHRLAQGESAPSATSEW